MRDHQPLQGYNAPMLTARAVFLARTFFIALLVFAAPAALIIALAACSRLDPPTLTPVSGTVTGVTPSGITLKIKLEAENPNSIGLTTREVSAKITLDSRYDAGTVKISHPVNLPAKKRTTLEVPVTFAWRDLAELAGLSASGRDIPYTVDGTVTIGGESINVDVPFRITGALTQKQLLDATLNSLGAAPLERLRFPLFNPPQPRAHR
jgi:LEA14-like dessication related protein